MTDEVLEEMFFPKQNATMHRPRKPGQQIEVDWEGDPSQKVHIFNSTGIKRYLFLPYKKLRSRKFFFQLSRPRFKVIINIPLHQKQEDLTC